ncbi:HlyD family secretion protein [Dankookia sp. P2]|uniref:HlyD family secretion protein n=1 Tax=Dankookia sp. P2 TaxID=3423955 RepID=UPI003D66F639
MPEPRLLNTGLALGLGLALLAGGAGFVLSRSLVVYSDFAAVSSALRLVRAPQGGIVSLPEIGLGSALRAGTPLALLEPVVPPQVLAEVEPQAQALAARVGQLRGELEQAEAGFENFRRRAKAGFDAAATHRQLAERQVMLQQRIQGRIATLARSAAATPMQADQLEVELLAQRRALADAVLAEVTARNLLEDAQAGRFVSDGRTTQRTPQEIRRELEAAEAARREMLGTLERLGTRITLTAPCDCQVAQLGATAGSFVAAGDPILGLAEPVMPDSVEVDALVDATRLGFLRQGQAVEVFLAGDAQATPGRVTSITYNPENQGRIGLPDNLRSLKSYGVLTVTLEGGVPQARPGLPALVKAPLALRQVFRSLPGMAWLVTERAGARPPEA